MVEISTLTPAIVAAVFLLALYGAMKYAEKLWGPNPETWDPVKYLQVFGAAVLVTAIGYLSTGVLTTATIDQIAAILNPALEILGGSLFTLVGYKTVKNIATAPAAAVAAAAVAPEEPPVTGPTGQPYGLVKVLGFYGPSAYANEPKQAQTYPIMQVPMLYFDLVCERAGKLMYAIWVDGKPAHNYEALGIDFQTVGDRRAVSFDYPTLIKTPGMHVISFKTGHDVMPGTIWDQEMVFALTFAGVLQPD